MGNLLVVQSKVKEVAKKKGFRFGADAVTALSKCVETCVTKAGERAKANRRQTIQAKDL